MYKVGFDQFCDNPVPEDIFACNDTLNTTFLSELHPEAESISAYPEQVELFFTANSITNDKVVVFLSVVGGIMYSLLRYLLAPEKHQCCSKRVMDTMLQRIDKTIR